MADDRAIRALIAAGLKLARETTSGRLALAQAAAVVDPAALPRDIADRVAAELRAAREAVRPLSPQDVAKVLERAWGAKPDKVVGDLDLSSPIAVTPGAQVHRARLEGLPVAVKLLRPGLAELVRADLALLDTLAGPASAAFPGADIGALLREARERVLDELDLEHGAGAQRTAARALRREDTLSVPKVISELTIDDVLVCELVEGRSLPAPGDEALARLVLRFFLGSARAIGLVHADPDPANVIVTDRGIAVVDWGATAVVSTAVVDHALAALRALRDNDPEHFGDALVDGLGVLADAASAARALELARHIGGELLAGPARLDAAALRAAAERAESRFGELLELALAARLPAELMWPARMLGVLVGTLARLEVTMDWVPAALAAGEAGW